jgi:hypothetical protein
MSLLRNIASDTRVKTAWMAGTSPAMTTCVLSCHHMTEA